jgi:hypothetical protein
MPLPEWNRDDETLQQRQKAIDLNGVSTDTQPERILQHQRKEPGRRFATKDWCTKTGSQQSRDTPDVINMDMRNHKRLDTCDIKADRRKLCPSRRFAPLL